MIGAMKRTASVSAKINAEDPSAPTSTSMDAALESAAASTADGDSLTDTLDKSSAALGDGSIANVLAQYMSGGNTQERENADILKTQQQLSTFPGSDGACVCARVCGLGVRACARACMCAARLKNEDRRASRMRQTDGGARTDLQVCARA